MFYNKVVLLLPALLIVNSNILVTAAQNVSSQQFLGTTVQYIVQRTVSSCPEIFGFSRNNEDIEQSFLCKTLLWLYDAYKERNVARAYYGGPAYHTYVSGFEPMTLLAGLAFLAFLLQTLHALLYRNPSTTTLAPVTISRGSSELEPEFTKNVISAIENYVR